jgi:peroxiredoxin Q/BCP
MRIFSVIFITSFISLKTFAQEIKDFTLKSATNNVTFTLSKSKGKLIVLHFLLKTECPYCIKHTNEYFEKASTLPNVLQVFIKPDDEKEIKVWADKLKGNSDLEYPIYQDPEGKLADRFKIPSGYAFHRQIVHYPALILLNEKGEEIFRYVGKNNTDRFSFEDLKNKIQELKPRK